MLEKQKDFLAAAFNGLGCIPLIVVPLLFLFVWIKGLAWFVPNVVPVLIEIGWVILAINIVVLLPLSVSKKLRRFTGTTMFFSSYLFGVLSWVLGLQLTLIAWGIWGFIIGLIFAGLGFVPLGLIAAAIKGDWQFFLILLTLIAVTFGARFAGLAISLSANDDV